MNRLLEEIREIRLSERRFYQKITDIYATSVDYNRDAPTTKAFFSSVPDKARDPGLLRLLDLVTQRAFRALPDRLHRSR